MATLAATPPSVELPFELHPEYGAILVAVKVNGRPATMLLDTGAATTIVSAELAGIDRGTLGHSRFRDGKAGLQAVGIWTRASLDLGGWRTSLDAGTIDLDDITRRYGRRIDGLLGQDVLRRFARVTIDFEAKKLLLARNVQ